MNIHLEGKSEACMGRGEVCAREVGCVVVEHGNGVAGRKREGLAEDG